MILANTYVLAAIIIFLIVSFFVYRQPVVNSIIYLCLRLFYFALITYIIYEQYPLWFSILLALGYTTITMYSSFTLSHDIITTINGYQIENFDNLTHEQLKEINEGYRKFHEQKAKDRLFIER